MKISLPGPTFIYFKTTFMRDGTVSTLKKKATSLSIPLDSMVKKLALAVLERSS